MNQKVSQGFIWVVIIYVMMTWIYNFYFATDILNDTELKRNISSKIVQDSSSNSYLFETVEHDDFLTGHFPLVGDSIITVNNQVLNDSLFNYYFVDKKTGTSLDSISVTVGSEIGRWDVTLIFPGINKTSYILPLILLGLLPLPFFAVAIWAMMKQGRSEGVRVLALLIISLSVIFSISLEGMAFGIRSSMTNTYNAAESSFTFHPHNLPNLLLSTIGTGFWLHLSLLFPSASTFIKRRKWLVYVLCYFIVIPFFVSWLMDPESMLTEAKWTNESSEPLSYYAMTIMSTAQLIAGFVILWIRSKRTDSPLEKRQVKILLQTVGVGLIAVTILSLILFLIITHASATGTELNVMLVGVIFILFLFALMLIPLGFAYSFSRYRLLEVQIRLRKGITFLLTTGGVVVIAFLIIFILTSMTLKHFQIEKRSAIVFYSLLVALAYYPFHNFISRKVERHIFRARWKMQEMLKNFLAITSSFPNRKKLWEAFGARLKENIGVNSMSVLFFEEEEQQFHNIDISENPFPSGGVLHHELQKRISPLLVEEIRANNEITLHSDENRWLDENEVVALIPIQLRGKMKGLLALGFEYGYEDIKAEELDLLVSITNRVAVENENLRLLEENIEVERLEEQLAMARSVQERILPGNLPETPGLQIAAICEFCLEVAGDMYDIIQLSGNRTLVTIGDVSGKGAGAAMVMANLQASLRALADLDISLAEIVRKVNIQVYNATSAEQFVTYFAAIFDTDNNKMTYVNAGHNPPYLLKADQNLKELSAGGLILGILPDTNYEEEDISFELGDFLVTFTDGITEAENEDDEMFGEERLIQILKETYQLSSNQMLAEILDQVSRFENNKSPEDDKTLVIVKAE